MNAHDRKKKRIISAIQESKGLIGIAAQSLGLTYHAVYWWIHTDEEVKKIYEEVNEINLDFAEVKLLGAIDKGKDWAICFYLKCKGKKRGYVERQELAGVPGSPLVLAQEKELAEMSPELATQKYLELIKSVEVNVLESNAINKKLQLKENNEENKFKRK